MTSKFLAQLMHAVAVTTATLTLAGATLSAHALTEIEAAKETESLTSDGSVVAGAATSKYAVIAPDGKDLNPDGYVLANERVRQGVVDLYVAMKDKMGGKPFTFRVSGGDRHIDDSGLHRSSTNGSVIIGSAKTSQHLRHGNTGGDAVDIVIIGVPSEIKKWAREKTAFAGGYHSDDYAKEPHDHYGLPRQVAAR